MNLKPTKEQMAHGLDTMAALNDAATQSPDKKRDSDDFKVGVILPASQIPDNTKVHKVGGSVAYYLRKSLLVYGGDEIEPKPGTFFLVETKGKYIAAVNEDSLLVCRMRRSELNEFMNRLAPAAQDASA